MSSFRLASPPCIVALKQLTKALETTQECIERWFNNEDSAPIVPHNALPGNRQSLGFIQAVFKHNFSSAIDDAIKAVEELRFEVKKCRKKAESAFKNLWYLYDLLRFRNLQGHERVENPATVATCGSVRTLESISNQIAGCSASSAEDGGEFIDDSNDTVQRLREQALRADLHPPPISAHVLSNYRGEGAISEDGLSVRVGLSQNSTFTEIMVHRAPHQPISSRIWRKIKCHIPQCWSEHRERQTQMTQVTLPSSITLPHSRLYLPTTNIR